MTDERLTIKVAVKNLDAFRVAYVALLSIVAAEPDSDDPDTRDGRYGIAREIAEEALGKIDRAAFFEGGERRMPRGRGIV